MSKLQLYCFGESGNSYKSALMLELCGLDWQAIPVDFFNGETRSPEFRREVNELGEVPVLVDGELKLTQSGVILDYLAEKTGKFCGATPEERREILRWMLFDNHKFTSYIATLRYLVSLTKTPEGPVTEFLRGRIMGSMKILDGHLTARKFLLGDKPTIADFSLAGYMFYGEELPFETPQHVVAWRERIRALPGWKHPYELMERRKPD
jgi:glutathione S-transferase